MDEAAGRAVDEHLVVEDDVLPVPPLGLEFDDIPLGIFHYLVLVRPQDLADAVGILVARRNADDVGVLVELDSGLDRIGGTWWGGDLTVQGVASSRGTVCTNVGRAGRRRYRGEERRRLYITSSGRGRVIAVGFLPPLLQLDLNRIDFSQYRGFSSMMLMVIVSTTTHAGILRSTQVRTD